MQSWVRLLALTAALLALLFTTRLVPTAQAQEVEEAVEEPVAEASAEPDQTEAQDEEEGEKGDGDRESWAGIEEITVTANKREQAIQDVPISMSALQSDFIEESGITEFGQLQQFVPNLKINASTDSRSTVIRIRGIGSVGSNAGIDPSVGVFIDGVYQGRAGMSVADLLDIERVEVLRGPQGTLYGKNTAAGAINIHTKRPIYDFESMLEVVLGNYKDWQLRGYLNVPLLNDRVAARFSAYRVKRDGFDINRFNGQDVNDANKLGGRARFLIDATPNLEILVSGDISYENTKCCVADIVTYEGGTALSRPGDNFAGLLWLEEGRGYDYGAPDGRAPRSVIDTPRGAPEAWYDFLEFSETIDETLGADRYDRVVGANDAPRNKITIGGTSVLAELAAGDITFSSLSAYRYYGSDSLFDGDFSVFDADVMSTDVTLHQFSQEFQAISPSGETFEYQGGLYFYYQNMETLGRLSIEDGYTFLKSSYNDDSNLHKTYSLATYGQGTYNLTDQWSLTGGIRLSWEKKTRVGSQIADGPAPLPGLPSTCKTTDAPPVCGPDQFLDNDKNWTNVSGMFSLRYFPMEGVMLYGTYSRGFKSGGFNQLRTSEAVRQLYNNTQFDPEYSTNVEAGAKTSWFDRRLTLNGTAFYTWYSDFQSQTFNGRDIKVVNAGSMRSYGVESELSLVPLPNLIIGAALGFNIAKYKFYPDAENTLPNMYEESGGNMMAGVYSTTQDLSGKQIDNAPRWNFNAFAQYHVPVPIPGLSVLWKAQVEYVYTSMMYLAQDLDPALKQDATNILNLRTGFAAEDEMWEMVFWMKNVTDEQWSVVGFDVPIVSGYAAVNAPPRQFGATLRLRF